MGHFAARPQGDAGVPAVRFPRRVALRARQRALAKCAGVRRHSANSNQRGGAHVRLDRHPGQAGRAQPDCARTGAEQRADTAAVHRDRRRDRARAGADAPDGAADPHRAVESRPESRGRVAGARCRRMAHPVAGDRSAVAARCYRRLHPDLFRLRDRVRDADPDRWRATDLHAVGHLPAGDRRQ